MTRLIEKLQKEKAQFDKELFETEEQMRQHSEEILVLTEAIELAKAAILKGSQNRQFIEDTVTDCLQYVKGPEHEFQFRDIVKDGIIKGVQPVIIIDGYEHTDIQQFCGGGLFSLCDAILRIVTVILMEETANIIVFDEPWPEIDVKAQARFGEYLTNLCEKTGLQLIIITHSPTLYGKVYEIKKEDGVSSATQSLDKGQEF